MADSTPRGRGPHHGNGAREQIHLPGNTLTVSLWPAERPRQAGGVAA